MKPAKRRLFTPGDGATPPLLSGREEQQAVLSRCLSDLLDGESPPHNVVLIGPARQWQDRSAQLVQARVPGERFRGRGRADATRHTRFAQLGCRVVAIFNVDSVTAPQSGHRHRRLDRVAGKNRHARPPDPALDREMQHQAARRLAGRSAYAGYRRRQRAAEREPAGARRSAVLASAGRDAGPAEPSCPDWTPRSGTVWAPAGWGSGRLSRDATRTALHEPLQAQNVHLHEAALAQVVDESQSYPYFVQLWGEALWQQHSAAGATSLTTRHVDVARPVVSAQAAEYYQDRYRELEAASLLAAAVALRPVFEASADAEASDREIDALATTGADATARLAARDELNRLGYIWCPPGQLPPVTWRAGIPSLMAHVQRQFAKA